MVLAGLLSKIIIGVCLYFAKVLKYDEQLGSMMF